MTFVGLPRTPTTRSMTWQPSSNMIPPRILGQVASRSAGPTTLLMTAWTSNTSPSQPALEELAEQHDGGVVAVHVAHLHEQLLLRGRVQDAPVLRERLAGRLVEVDVLARGDAGLGRVEQVAHARLDEHGLEARHVRAVARGSSTAGPR